MRIVFMGTPDFAVPCLKALVDAGHEAVGVFSQPDKPVGRKQVLTPPPVKECALSCGIPVFQPARLKDADIPSVLADLKPEILVVVAYGKILPKEVLEYPKYGAVNVHASLLPKYRGAAPIQWAIINGETQTGVTVMQMDEGLDTGDMLLVKKTDIGENETSAELFDRLSDLGASALIETLALIENGAVTPIKQPEGDFGYAKMITKELSPIDWKKSALEVHNLVRGLQTFPAATTVINGKNVKVHKTVLSSCRGGSAGQVMENRKKLIVSCGDSNCVEILQLQPEGKKRMDAASFLQGNPVQTGAVIGA